MRERERKKERKKEGGRENCSSLWRKRAPRARACGTPAARQNEHGGGGAHVLRVHFCKALLVRELRRAREGLVDKEPQQLGLCPGRLRAQLHRAETLALGALKQRLDRRRAERRLLRLHLLRFRRSASRRPSTPAPLCHSRAAPGHGRQLLCHGPQPLNRLTNRRQVVGPTIW